MPSIDVLEMVQRRNKPAFTTAVLKQVLLEIHHRQQELRFTYSVPPRVSLVTTLELARRFLAGKTRRRIVR